MSATELLDRALHQLDTIIKQASTLPAKADVPQVASTSVSPAAPPSAPVPTATVAPTKCEANTPAVGSVPDVVAFDKACLKVGKVIEVEHMANSEKLYKCKVDLGNGDVRQVLTGLRQYVARDELFNRLVVVVANLKPAKLAGEESAAMILAAEAGPEDALIVRLLTPPDSAQPGDLVGLHGTERKTDAVKVLKSDAWKKVVGELTAVGGCATFTGVPLTASGGGITVPSDIPNGSPIH